MSKWYNLDSSGSVPEIFIYNEIGYGGITAEELVNQVKALNSKKLTIRINSYGGDAFAGLAIYNFLKDYDVTVKIDGIAASIASVIAMAGKGVPELQDGASMLIHKAWSMSVGNADDMERTALELKKIDGQIADIYAKSTGIDKDKWLAVMKSGLLLSTDESVGLGLAKKGSEKSTEKVSDENLTKYGFTGGISNYTDKKIYNLLTDTEMKNLSDVKNFTDLKNYLDEKFKNFIADFKKENKNEAPTVFNLTPDEKAKVDEAVTGLAAVQEALKGLSGDAAPTDGEAAPADQVKDVVNKLTEKIKAQDLEIKKMSAPGYKAPDPEEEKNEQVKKNRTQSNEATKNAVKEAIKNIKR